MKKIILLAAITLASVGAYAQHAVGTVTLQPKVGLNVANVTEEKDSKTRLGLAAGLEVEYQLSDIVSLSAGAIYSQQGYKKDGIKGRDDYETTSKLDYINVPILANVYVTKGLAVKLGLQPGFNITSKYNQKVTILGNVVETTRDMKAQSVDFSIPVGLSYEFANVQLDARYNWGISKVLKNKEDKNSVFQITLGYKFAL